MYVAYLRGRSAIKIWRYKPILITNSHTSFIQKIIERKGNIYISALNCRNEKGEEKTTS